MHPRGVGAATGGGKHGGFCRVWLGGDHTEFVLGENPTGAAEKVCKGCRG